MLHGARAGRGDPRRSREFPFGPGGYYAVYFRGPDRLEFEVAHMPLAERRAKARGPLR